MKKNHPKHPFTPTLSDLERQLQQPYYQHLVFKPIASDHAAEQVDDESTPQYTLPVLNEVRVIQQSRLKEEKHRPDSPSVPRPQEGDPAGSDENEGDHTAHEGYKEYQFSQPSVSQHNQNIINEGEGNFLPNANKQEKLGEIDPEELAHFHQALFALAIHHGETRYDARILLESFFPDNKYSLLLYMLQQGRTFQTRAIQFRLAQLRAIVGLELPIEELAALSRRELAEQLHQSTTCNFLFTLIDEADLPTDNQDGFNEIQKSILLATAPERWYVHYNSLDLIDEKEQLLQLNETELLLLFDKYVQYTADCNKQFVESWFMQDFAHYPERLKVALKAWQEEEAFFEELLNTLGIEATNFKNTRIELGNARRAAYRIWASHDNVLEALEARQQLPAFYQPIRQATQLSDLQPFLTENDWTTLQQLPQLYQLPTNSDAYRKLQKMAELYLHEGKKTLMDLKRHQQQQAQAQNFNQADLKTFEVARKIVQSAMIASDVFQPTLSLSKQLSTHPDLLLTLSAPENAGHERLRALLLLGADLSGFTDKQLNKMPGLLQMYRELCELDEARVSMLSHMTSTDDMTELYVKWSKLYQQFQGAHTVHFYPADNANQAEVVSEASKRLFLQDCEREITALKRLLDTERTSINKLNVQSQRYINMNKFLNELEGYTRLLDQKLRHGRQAHVDDELLNYLPKMQGYLRHLRSFPCIPTKFKTQIQMLMGLLERYESSPMFVLKRKSFFSPRRQHLAIVKSNTLYMDNFTQAEKLAADKSLASKQEFIRMFQNLLAVVYEQDERLHRHRAEDRQRHEEWNRERIEAEERLVKQLEEQRQHAAEKEAQHNTEISDIKAEVADLRKLLIEKKVSEEKPHEPKAHEPTVKEATSWPINPGKAYGHFAASKAANTMKAEEVEGIRYGQVSEEHYTIEIDYVTLKLGKVARTELQKVIEKEGLEAFGCIDGSVVLKHGCIIQLAFDMEQAAKECVRLLKQAVIELRAKANVHAPANSYAS